jgi:hypothetical protein
VVYGVLTGSRTGSWLGIGTVLPLAAGALLLTAFVLVQRAAANPSLDLQLFGRR